MIINLKKNNNNIQKFVFILIFIRLIFKNLTNCAIVFIVNHRIENLSVTLQSHYEWPEHGIINDNHKN